MIDTAHLESTIRILADACEDDTSPEVIAAVRAAREYLAARGWLRSRVGVLAESQT